MEEKREMEMKETGLYPVEKQYELGNSEWSSYQDCIGPKQNQNGNEARKILIGPKYVLSAHGKIYESQYGEVSWSQAVDNLACVSVCTQYLLLNGYFVLNVFLQVNTAVELNWIEQRRKGPRSMIEESSRIQDTR